MYLSRYPVDTDGTVSFGFVGLKPGFEEALAYIRDHHPNLLS